MAAVGASVRRVEWRAAVEEIAAATVAPRAVRERRVDERGERRHPVDDCAVDDLTAPGSLGLEERCEHPDHEIHRAAAEIAEQIERRYRRTAAFADSVQRAREGDVVDVVPGCMRKRSGLPPSGHAPVDEAWITLERRFRTKPEALHHAGAEAFDQRVGVLDQAEGRPEPRCRFEIELDQASPALDYV